MASTRYSTKSNEFDSCLNGEHHVIRYKDSDGHYVEYSYGNATDGVTIKNYYQYLKDARKFYYQIVEAIS